MITGATGRPVFQFRGRPDVPMATLELTREQILRYRRSVGALDERLQPGPASLRRAAWAGLQDSMPRAAVLSIHARVHGTGPDAWEDLSLVQLWGPRHSAYVVAALDLAVFSLGRLPDGGEQGRRADDLAGRLHAFLDGRRMSYSEAGHGLGVHPNSLRYAASTGTVLIRWTGPASPPSGTCHRRTSSLATRASSSPAATCTSSGRQRPRHSLSGPGSGRERLAMPRSTRSAHRRHRFGLPWAMRRS